MAKPKNIPPEKAAASAAATQTPSTSASAPAALADREGGAEDAASSNGVEAPVVTGEGVSAAAGDDVIAGPADPEAGGFAQTVAETAVRLHATLTSLSETAQPSPGSAPQASGLASADDHSDPAATKISLVAAEDEAFEGSSILPAVIMLPLDVTVTLGELVIYTARARGDNVEAWNALDPERRERLLEHGLASLAYEIQTPWHVADAVEIEAVSRDDQPYRRCGVVWTSQAQRAVVHPLVAARLKSDPFILVKAERLASED